jgi:lipopolysaccharide transport system ATP-binding protein
MSDILVNVDNVSKKFCRRLRRSLWYGVKDLGSELIGRNNSHKDLRKDEFWAVQDVSFQLKRGETLGLIGPNGSGKTTLLRMINGLIKPDGGRIEVRGRVGALIALGAGFNPILTGRENIYVNASVLGIPKAEVDRKFDEIVDFSGIEEFIDTPVQSYSSGMAVRLGFAVAAHMNPDILLVDEVLAVGDEGFQSKCLNKIGELRGKGIGIILVSHNMHTISTFSKQVMLMTKGKHKLFDNVSEGVRGYRRIFVSKDDMDVQKVCNGNEKITFYDVKINKRIFYPGDSFTIHIRYDSVSEYPNAEIDIVILSSNESTPHFQATNKAYDEEIHLRKGKNELRIQINSIRINNAVGIITVAIWAKDRTELLFWWRIPVEFEGASHSTGNSFLDVSYST